MPQRHEDKDPGARRSARARWSSAPQDPDPNCDERAPSQNVMTPVRRSTRLLARNNRIACESDSQQRDVDIIYTIHPSIRKKDRQILEEMLEAFHDDEEIQAVSGRIFKNATKYLKVEKIRDGVGYKAKEPIPADTRICLYRGALKRTGTRPGNHDWSLGRCDLPYDLDIDGSPMLGDWPLGTMSMVNHSCEQFANCRHEMVLSDKSSLVLFVLTTIRQIPTGEE